MLALSQKKKKNSEKKKKTNVSHKRQEERRLLEGSVQTNFLEKSALCARSLNCEGFKGHGHSPAVEELLNCGSLQPGCSQRKLRFLLRAGAKLKAKGQSCFTNLKKNK